MNNLSLLKTKKEYFYFLSLLLFVFFINISNEYLNFKNLKTEEIYETNNTIVNIYKKEKYNVLKLQNKSFTFFTSVQKDLNVKKLQKIRVLIVTKNISFYDYLKGFYANSFNYILYENNSVKNNIYEYINSKHENNLISSVYSALIMATPVDSSLRELFSIFGISHLVALSGFHLSIIFVCSFFLLNIIYKPIHNRYFPYRNIKNDITLICIVFLFSYLIFINIVPSFLRAFVMFVITYFLYRRGIKIISFETLLLTFLTIISIFPNLIFSLSLWFSIAGVFYIYLYITYFKNLNKYIQLIFFNIWIYLALNPIVHFFFYETSFFQLLSPLLTLLFVVFYPIVLIFHIIGFADIFDSNISWVINQNYISWQKETNIYFFISYISISFLSIFSKKSFYVLNILIFIFFIYLFK